MRAQIAKRKGRHRWFRLRWLKWGGWLLLLGFILPSASRPYLLWYQEEQRVRRKEQQLEHLREENCQLEEAIYRLNTPLGMEVEARRQGWLRPGEWALLLPSHAYQVK